MKHPLENPSLTPIGFVFPIYNKRVFEKLREGLINGDYYSALFWQKKNCYKCEEPRPAETIIHTIMPGLATVGRIETGDFTFLGKPYLSRDIMVLSTFVQWFGTNVGRSFIRDKPWALRNTHPAREFTEKFALENHHDKLISGRVHVCTEDCGHTWFGWECQLEPTQVSKRDRLIVHSLMYWLGTEEGRTYMKEYNEYINKICNNAWAKRKEKLFAS